MYLMVPCGTAKRRVAAEEEAVQEGKHRTSSPCLSDGQRARTGGDRATRGRWARRVHAWWMGESERLRSTVVRQRACAGGGLAGDLIAFVGGGEAAQLVGPRLPRAEDVGCGMWAGLHMCVRWLEGRSGDGSSWADSAIWAFFFL